MYKLCRADLESKTLGAVQHCCCFQAPVPTWGSLISSCPYKFTAPLTLQMRFWGGEKDAELLCAVDRSHYMPWFSSQVCPLLTDTVLPECPLLTLKFCLSETPLHVLERLRTCVREETCARAPSMTLPLLGQQLKQEPIFGTCS